MPDDVPLRPATPEEIEETLSLALYINGRKRFHTAVPMMAQITAEHLRRNLDQSGFVVMKRSPAKAHSAPDPNHAKRL